MHSEVNPIAYRYIFQLYFPMNQHPFSFAQVKNEMFDAAAAARNKLIR